MTDPHLEAERICNKYSKERGYISTKDWDWLADEIEQSLLRIRQETVEECLKPILKEIQTHDELLKMDCREIGVCECFGISTLDEIAQKLRELK